MQRRSAIFQLKFIRQVRICAYTEKPYSVVRKSGQLTSARCSVTSNPCPQITLGKNAPYLKGATKASLRIRCLTVRSPLPQWSLSLCRCEANTFECILECGETSGQQSLLRDPSLPKVCYRELRHALIVWVFTRDRKMFRCCTISLLRVSTVYTCVPLCNKFQLEDGAASLYLLPLLLCLLRVPLRPSSFIFVTGTLNKIFAIEIFNQIESLGAEICRRNLHIRQKVAENNEFSAFFTNCCVQWPRGQLQKVTFNIPGNGRAVPTLLAVARVSQPAPLPL